MRLGDVAMPATPAGLAARKVAGEYCSPALLNHSLRAFLWAMGFADLGGYRPDVELLYVAALLHDTGLVPAFDNHTRPFETAGGDVAWVLTAGAGWPQARRQRARDVIERHMWTSVDPALDVEGHLLEVATSLDISGQHAQDLPAGYLREVLTAYPRLGLAEEFTACLTDQAARKPASAAHRLVTGGLARALAAHPLDDLAPGGAG